jgi:hypothetical protein
MSGQKSFGLEKAGNSFCSRLEQSSLDNLTKCRHETVAKAKNQVM